MREVVVHGDARRFAQQILAGSHTLTADEPGGTGIGPSPYDLLLPALGACTSMTVGMYARRKAWPLESVTVRLRHLRFHASDCATCEAEKGMLDRIDRDVQFIGA